MSLHTQYRPKDFDEVIGNRQIVRSLESLFEHGKLSAHVFLFHGASGCGKTTFARIIANKLECSPTDFIEINAGNNRGIDTAREILKTVHYLPTQGDYKVILFDEVHQATKDFQNALLKVLEDTPQHVYFILCTTEPQKLIATIRNRCVTYEVESLKSKKMLKLLEDTAEKEKGNVSTDALTRIINKSDGCPRLALILLEQIIHLPSKEQIKAIKVFKTQEEKVIELCRAILNKERWEKISKILKGMEEEPEHVRRAVLGYMNSVMLNKNNPHCMLVYLAFKEPFYDTGKAGLTFATYKAVNY
tara:strand:+ start:2723 stop:3631 length:909 start_codon:yes stop_codon:yes gene_type:complete